MANNVALAPELSWKNREITGNRQFKCSCIIVPGFGQIGCGDQSHEVTGSFQTC
jgi:hypothetical protein